MSNEDKSTPHTHVQMKLRLPQPMTVYVMTQFDPVTGTSQTLPWLAADGWTATALTGVEYSGLRMTPAKDWSRHLDADDYLDAVDEAVSHYGTATVWEKTFPAGVVSMKGNGGGEGYIWTSGVDGGHGSYLMFLAHPSNRPTPPAYTHNAADTKCPHQHEDRLFRNPVSGGGSGITLD